ncbi:MAG: 1-acyl-sn-glycerol-3-phosphate acyltransferase [Candidatus Azobacteroides sp.]|nr:1-acyl-sn-glycerol-3-phosphate acyltransferase [Candidatus Azobacteroides sp.]
MSYSADFDEIRPLEGNEISQAIDRLLKEDRFRHAVEFSVPGIDFEEFSTIMRSCKSIFDFQDKLIIPFLFGIANRTTSELTIYGMESIRKEKPATYISNHRDIILDAAFFNIQLFRDGFDSTEVAIGDNLLIYPWINDLVRINKSFIVQRGVSKRQMLEVSKRLSSYIHYVIKEKKNSLWIAQREGRAKDSNDRTQDSILKMLSLGGEKSFLENIKELNVTPLSISYEYDPCDYLKAQEFQLKRDNPEYKKQDIDDLRNMETGIFGFKGKVHFHICNSINDKINQISPDADKTIQVSSVGKLIDEEIYKNYLIYPINYIAYDQLHGSNNFEKKYTSKEKEDFNAYIEGRINKIILPEKDKEYLTTKLLEMYSNPLKNKLMIEKKL